MLRRYTNRNIMLHDHLNVSKTFGNKISVLLSCISTGILFISFLKKSIFDDWYLNTDSR